jgi:hypothetical protein
VAVHTTEFNVRSNDATVKKGPNVVYRQRDLLALSEALAKRGFTLASLDFDTGDHAHDLNVDAPPYMTSGKPHLKLDIDGQVATSFLLIIEKTGKGKTSGFFSRFARA